MAQGYSSQLVSNVDDFLDFHRVEKQTIEFKRSWNTGPTSRQVLHTICAFANDFFNDDGVEYDQLRTVVILNFCFQ